MTIADVWIQHGTIADAFSDATTFTDCKPHIIFGERR
jgi:hypothetical protein